MAKARCSRPRRAGQKDCFQRKNSDRLGEQKWNEAPTVIVYEAAATLNDGDVGDYASQ